MHNAGFNLREWTTNSPKTLRVIKSEGESISNSDEVSILGMRWNITADSLSIQVFQSGECLTKRQIVSQFSKLFDPFGYVLPISIRGKILVQDLWKDGIGWDDKVSDIHKSLWDSYTFDIGTALESIKLDRRLNVGKNPSLHLFADASKKSYGAVAYIVSEGKVEFLMAKSRLAPMNSPSLPQLELTAINVAARLAKFILDSYSQEIQFNELYLWYSYKLVAEY